MPSHQQELSDQLYAVLRELTLLMRRAAGQHEVSAQHLGILGSLRSGPRRMTALAAEHGVRTPTMTVHVSNLEQADAVRRGSDSVDARAVVVELTEQGRRLLESGRAARLAYLGERLAGLSEDERAAVAAALPALAKLCADDG